MPYAVRTRRRTPAPRRRIAYRRPAIARRRTYRRYRTTAYRRR